MTKWVCINESWIFRPVIQGWELISYKEEQAIDLVIEEPDTEIAECIAILQGEEPIPEDRESFNELIKKLIELRAITIIDNQPVNRQSPESNENLRKLWQVRRKLVGTNGPVPRVYWIDPRASRVKPIGVYFFSALYTIGQVVNQYENDWSVGISPILEIAELKAIMEALERHASGIIPTRDLIKASKNQLGNKAIDPHRVVSYTERQYQSGLQLMPFSEDRTYFWKTVYTFPEMKEWYLPIDCLYYPITEEFAPQLYTLANSSGVAAGFSLEDGLLRGIYETIERDAFMVVWLNRLAMPTISKKMLSQELQIRIAAFGDLGYEIYLINLILDTVPVILVAAVNEHSIPALVLGMAANLDPEKAIAKALDEILHQLYWDFREDHKVDIVTDPKKVVDVSGHAGLYATSRYLQKASFLWQGKLGGLPETGLSPELESVLALLAAKGVEVLIADLTPPKLKKAGILVVRAIPLGLVPISFGYKMEPLGVPRIQELPKQLGLKVQSWRNGKPFTHPFA
jgi:ribosomal protein S12 methylthiotransferase accessory factor